METGTRVYEGKIPRIGKKETITLTSYLENKQSIIGSLRKKLSKENNKTKIQN